MNNIYGIILSGGTGSRIHSQVPKQFLTLAGRSILSYSLDTFSSWGFFKSIVVVSHPDFIEQTEKEASNYLQEYDKIIIGGSTRHESTLNGIQAVPWDSGDIVIIHDSARPLVSHAELHSVCNSAVLFNSSTVSSKVNETLVHAQDDLTQSIIERNTAYSIKTPQALHTSILSKLLPLELNYPPTDLCSWVLEGGFKPALVSANPYNIKITLEQDLKIAEAFLPLFQEMIS